MNTLFAYLYTQEIRNGFIEACRLRFLILGTLLAGFIIYGFNAWSFVIFLLLVLNLLSLKNPGTTQNFIKFLLIFIDISLVTLAAYVLKATDFMTPVFCLYLLILYSSSLYLKDNLILLAGSSIIVMVNLNYFISLSDIRKTLTYSVLKWPGFFNQIILTMIVLFFTIAVLSRSQIIKRLLINQQNYFDKVNSDNFSIFDTLSLFCRESGLSDRESEVLGILLKGKTYRMIAGDLFISLDTVKSHIKSIYKKTDVSSRAELVNKLQNMTLAGNSHSD